MSFEECLNDCLDRLQRGESLEACLARYPEHADDLRGLLQAGQVLRASPPPLSVTARSAGPGADAPRSRAAGKKALAAVAARVGFASGRGNCGCLSWSSWRAQQGPVRQAIWPIRCGVLQRQPPCGSRRIQSARRAPSGAGRAAAGRSAGALAGGAGYRSWGVDGGGERNRRGARRAGPGNERSQPGEIGPDRAGSRGL